MASQKKVKLLQSLVFIGDAGVGKDYLARVLEIFHVPETCPFFYSFASPIRQVCYSLLRYESKNANVSPERFYEVMKRTPRIFPSLGFRSIRQFMEEFGNDFMKAYASPWPHLLENTLIEDRLSSPHRTTFVVTDCRFEKEVDTLLKWEPAFLYITNREAKPSKGESPTKPLSLERLADIAPGRIYQYENSYTSPDREFLAFLVLNNLARWEE